MSRTVNCTLASLGRHIERDMAALQKRVNKAIAKTAHDGIVPIRSRVPVAFGELRESIQNYARGANGNPVIAVDAPHAAAVEIGSRPHTPDFEKLLAWVKLRGMQGLRGGKKRGSTTAKQSRRVASMLAGHVVGGSYSPVDAAEQVARAISRGIEKHGTKPHWFVRDSLGDIRILLDTNMWKYVHSGTGSEGAVPTGSGSAGSESHNAGSSELPGSSGTAPSGTGSRRGSGGNARGRGARSPTHGLQRDGWSLGEIIADNKAITERNRARAKENFAGKRVSNRWGYGPKGE